MYGPDAKHFKDVSAMKATCIYCNTTINGGAERRRCHLARVKGMGVNTCTKVPLLVRQEFSELQNKHASKKRKATEMKRIENMRSIAQKFGSTSGSAVPPEDAIANEMDEMEATWISWFKANDLPLSLKESPDFIQVIKQTINYGSSIMYHIFENSDNDELREAAKVHREVSKLCSILPGRDGEQNDERATNERAGERVGG